MVWLGQTGLVAFVALVAGFLDLGLSVKAQQTNNSSALTNNAAPSASSVTTGGTNINYQTNNAYNNEMGFAPGIFCRTPALYLGGSWGQSKLDAFDPVQNSGNTNGSYSANAGIVLPFGSPIINYCAQLAASIALDREISSQLSMLRTCAQLEKEGLVVDPIKFPLLKACAKEITASLPGQTRTMPAPPPLPEVPPLRPKTTRML
jgi:hypothetical protein